jgi:hypothetical protein
MSNVIRRGIVKYLFEIVKAKVGCSAKIMDGRDDELISMVIQQSLRLVGILIYLTELNSVRQIDPSLIFFLGGKYLLVCAVGIVRRAGHIEASVALEMIGDRKISHTSLNSRKAECLG